jgi:hypothetical protein
MNPPRTSYLSDQPPPGRRPAWRHAIWRLVRGGALGCLLLATDALAATNDTTSFWDKSLLAMELHHVDMKADSLFDAWSKLGRGFLVRSVLAVGEPDPVPSPFEFARDVCTVRELIGAMLETYAGYALSQDADTGVLWIHPAAAPYESLLPVRVAIPPGSAQVPALQGVVRRLQEDGAGTFAIRWRGIVEIFENACAYPVNLRPGLFAMRDVLNMCCQASPSRTFYIILRGPTALVNPGDLYDDGLPHMPLTPELVQQIHDGVLNIRDLPGAEPASKPLPVRPGSLRFWRLGMGGTGEAAPALGDVMEALASRNAHERWVARSFIGAGRAGVSIEQIIMQAPHGRKAIWASLAMLSMFNLATPSPYMLGLRTIQREISLETAATLDRGTAVLAAMEMARVGDDALLKKVARWNLGPDELATIDPDGVRIARSSSIVRAALKEANCGWPGLSAREIRDMEEQKPLLVPK